MIVGLLLHPIGRADEPVAADILLKNGILIDGTGAARRTGDVAIRGDRIVAVGKFQVTGTPQLVDCTGLIVAPGFIDLHNHSDEQILKPDTRSNLSSLSQGCTTVVTGNCGAGPVNAAAYFEAIESHGAGTNVAHLLPQGTLRQEVVGLANRPATEDELEKMRALTRQAMQDGVWGMSTGLIYVPGSYSNTDELVEIAKVVGEQGGIYARHMRDEGVELLAAVNELLEIGRRAELPVHVSHIKSNGQDAWGLIRQAAQMIETARKSGQRVTADQYPYIASSTSLLATVIPAAARADSREEFLKRLNSKEQGASIRAHIESVLAKKENGVLIRIARYEDRPDWVGRNLLEIAEEEGITPVELCVQIAQTGHAQVVNFGMSEDDVRFAMQIPWVATASDGRAAIPGSDRPHPRYYGTFARKIGFYALEEKVLTLEQAIRSCSGLPAEILGLPGRGVLAPDAFADVVVFDPTTYRDTATFDDPHRYATGVRHLFVNGKCVISQGYPTGALAGRVLRHELPKEAP
ncbi:MAG: D-aminoacylase [Planctomycetaceae bacterium]|nr:D-aminoacylase [Planctomycetaceae bacterium]